MPINFQQLQARIDQISRDTLSNREALQVRRERAWELLCEYAAELDKLRDKVETVARDLDPNLRCALPAIERLDACHPLPPLPKTASLIAVDGSQIVPNRHESLAYALINIGAVVLQVNSTVAPCTHTESELLFEEQLRGRNGSLLDEGAIALQRDARERACLLELARDSQPPVVALTDGPVELWGAKDPANSGEYQRFLQKYLADLEKLNALGVTLGGYVDKPGADLVIRLLEIAATTGEDLNRVREVHPLQGVSDRWLYGRLLKPGERSAVFALQSSSRTRYPGQSAIHFCYLNVGRDGFPFVARLEMPGWVAADAEKQDLLHALLIQQTRLLGAKPYPYLLHRAHETARVSTDEKEQLDALLSLILRRSGGEIESDLNKHAAKNLPARARRS